MKPGRLAAARYIAAEDEDGGSMMADGEGIFSGDSEPTGQTNS